MGWQENNLLRGAPVLGLESKVWLATPKFGWLCFASFENTADTARHRGRGLMPCPAILANWKVAAAASAALSI
jgi:hypothetical protein